MSAADKTRRSTPADLADIFNVTERVVMRAVHRDGWPHEKIGRAVRFSDEHIEAIRQLVEVRPPEPTAPRVDDWGTRGRGRAS
jgi:N-acyl-L-homoserine lactone synthetase